MYTVCSKKEQLQIKFNYHEIANAADNILSSNLLKHFLLFIITTHIHTDQ
jgi:hypothetical protein